MEIGIALSGGGVKGAAHIGVLKALEENNMKPKFIGGTSAGSIVAVLYAMGYTPDEILALFEHFSKVVIEADPRYFFTSMKENKKIAISGLMSGENIEKVMLEACRKKQIYHMQELMMPIVIPAVDAVDGKEYIFTNCPGEDKKYILDIAIGKAVRASSSFPAIYAPCQVEEHRFLDGGLLNNIPTREVRRLRSRQSDFCYVSS